MAALLYRYHRYLLLAFGLTLPIVLYVTDQMRSNNDLEVWLPQSSQARSQYLEFTEAFGGDEFVLIAVDLDPADPALVEAVCQRLDDLPEVRTCWSPERMQGVMEEFGVEEAERRERIERLLVGEGTSLQGIVALLSPEGRADRTGTVARINEVLDYCQLADEQAYVAGVPVFVAELDRIGSKEANVKYFVVTLIICLGLLFFTIRDWKLTGLVFAATVWAINATHVLICLVGGEMNLILNSISVLVMVFTMAVIVHYLHYFWDAQDADLEPNRERRSAQHAAEALRQAWRPSGLATLTTCIGVISLAWSDILPVQQFAVAAAMGAVVALFTGLIATPALVTLCPTRRPGSLLPQLDVEGYAERILRARVPLVVGGVTVLLVVSIGLTKLRSEMDPMQFLPAKSRLLAGCLRIEDELTRVDSVEAVVDFGTDDAPILEKLQRVRRLEEIMREHPAVEHTMSLASFFPESLSDNILDASRTLQKAQEQSSYDDFTACDYRLWRISARVNTRGEWSREEVLATLNDKLAGEPVHFTGLAPLLETAQLEIFDGFWKSVLTAFALISIAMMASLRSIRLGLVAMIPNMWPLCLVFGLLGWAGQPVDIAMLLSGSIALGLSVDGTFHYVSRYRRSRATGMSDWEALRAALVETGLPLTQATLITAAGLLGLMLSSFGPTVRFGVLMIAMLMAALVGDLLLLPALLGLRKRPTERSTADPAETYEPAHAA
ncbi:MMPL family transporter [Maioricimonas sp. JC845]|uniref:efflux RND transporter permease subunit n=1 Tax=Maioricimonas sp. JC845 TaxID=3232138 RepID=UPI0034589183